MQNKKKYVFIRRLESGIGTGGSEIINSYISAILTKNYIATNAVYLQRNSYNSFTDSFFASLKMFAKLTYGKFLSRKVQNITYSSISLNLLIKKIEREDNQNLSLIFLNAADYIEISQNYSNMKFCYFCQHLEFWDINFIQFKQVVQEAHKVVCVSDYLYQICQSLSNYRNVLLLKNHRLHHIPQQIIPTNFRIYDYIFFISHHYWKGYKDTLYCIKFLREQFPNIKICAFGTNEEASIKKYLSDFKIDYFTHINKSEVLDLFKKSKVFVYLSHFEGYGLPAVEALDCGTYVLSYNNYGINTVSSPRLKVVGYRDLISIINELPISIKHSESIAFKDVALPSVEENTNELIKFLNNNERLCQ